MIRTPQVLVTLSPEGALQMELPGANGSRRKVLLREGEAHATLTRVLEAQLASRTEIGEDGAPTQRQVKHWEEHSIFADDRCPFCLAEERTISAGTKQRLRAQPLATHGQGNSAVTIRRIAPKGRKASATRRSEEELGL